MDLKNKKNRIVLDTNALYVWLGISDGKALKMVERSMFDKAKWRKNDTFDMILVFALQLKDVLILTQDNVLKDFLVSIGRAYVWE